MKSLDYSFKCDLCEAIEEEFDDSLPLNWLELNDKHICGSCVSDIITLTHTEVLKDILRQ